MDLVTLVILANTPVPGQKEHAVMIEVVAVVRNSSQNKDEEKVVRLIDTLGPGMISYQPRRPRRPGHNPDPHCGGGYSGRGPNYGSFDINHNHRLIGHWPPWSFDAGPYDRHDFDDWSDYEYSDDEGCDYDIRSYVRRCPRRRRHHGRRGRDRSRGRRRYRHPHRDRLVRDNSYSDREFHFH